MTDPIPLNQSSKEIVIALINRDNGTTFTEAQVDFDTVTVMPSSFARNTSVRVFAIPGGGFTPSEKTVYYNRLNLATQWENTVPVVMVNSPSNTADLLPAINNIYGLNITLDDVENNTFLTSPHKVKALPSSLVWNGEVDFIVVDDESTNYITLTEEFAGAATPGFVYDSNKDYKKPSNVLLYEMLTEINSAVHPYNPAHFSLSYITAGSSGSTTVTLTANPGTGFFGTYDLNYTRLSLTNFISTDELPVSVFTDDGYTVGEIIPGTAILDYINETYDLDLSIDELSIPDTTLSVGNQVTAESLLENYLTFGSFTLEFV